MLEKTVFFRATSEPCFLPKSTAEVIFSGRSNVGKSSVINALCSQKNLARTSKTPGRTRSINVYSVAMKKWIIDLPGYGFARVSPKVKGLWQKMIEECIIQRRNKKLICLIIDAFVGPTELDFVMARWLVGYDVSFKVVANKCDKVFKGVTEDDVKNKIVESFDINESDVFVVSAREKRGFRELQTDIVKFLK